MRCAVCEDRSSDTRVWFTRRALLGIVPAVFLYGFACRRAVESTEEAMTPPESDPHSTSRAIEPLDIEESRWKALVSAEAYAVLFDEATERPFSSPLNAEKRSGTFVCAACYLPLFLSEAKFDSGTGWPSFFRAIEGNVDTKRDFKLIVPRTEYHCARCGGHQGHVFKDGPRPTGLRYCNNGLALAFVPEGDDLPELRIAP